MNRLLISGTHSGCGKTTVTCAALSAIKARGLTPTAFKCGPDYIDTLFHRSVSGVAAYTLDPFFLDGEGLRGHLAAHAGAISVIEGAMGYYDGIAETDEASAYTVARETRTSAVLTVNARGAGRSHGAVMQGFLRYKKDSGIAGVIFNNASEERYPGLKKLALEAGVKTYGFLPHNREWELPSRRLGLFAAEEIKNIQNILFELGRQAEQTLDMDGLLALAASAPGYALAQNKPADRVSPAARALIAVSRDPAFCFMYEENLALLRALGGEIIFFSPLSGEKLPENISGLYLCGGYPEEHAKALSENITMRQSIKRAAERGLPMIAEGGGFLYLHETLDGFPMCGVINGAAFKTGRLRRFGYLTLTAESGNLLCEAGESIRAHEFHYWESDAQGEGFTARKAGRDLIYKCAHATDALYAGFPQLFFPANPVFAGNFVKACLKTAEKFAETGGMYHEFSGSAAKN
ncbi:MAG: cobyrinate a,c-diamide synthase [Clostridiales bacterium]|nr:cobyrinate a,c-diamide synthase [Clostridiales bacterium]